MNVLDKDGVGIQGCCKNNKAFRYRKQHEQPSHPHEVQELLQPSSVRRVHLLLLNPVSLLHLKKKEVTEWTLYGDCR